MSSVQQFDFSLDLMSVLPWQKDSSPNIRALLEKKNEWYNSAHTQFWEDWHRDVFNLLTANDFGLNVWSIILDLPLYTNLNVSPDTYPAFGFKMFGRNFDQGNFATSGNISNLLTLDERRLLLLLRWFNLESDGSMYSINTAMHRIFKGNVYCLDNQDMTITYVFLERINDVLFTLLNQYDILPRPAGVGVKILISPRKSFGFANFAENFDQEFSQFGRTI